MRRIKLLALLAAASSLSPAMAVDVRYELRFESTWSAESHPVNFPEGQQHYSQPVGTVHNENAVFWEPGGLASLGVENIAELGNFFNFRNEMLAVAANGDADANYFTADFIGSPDSTTTEFVATTQFSKITFITMLAPSPDWFVGTSGLDLLVDGKWVDHHVHVLNTYDSGTDSGLSYQSPNANTSPAEPISVITVPPLGDGTSPIPVGTYTFTILLVDGRPPYDDFDGDGLNNLREAELGTDPTLVDSDVDGVIDGQDNCPATANVLQADQDLDQVGDLCDNCPAAANEEQGNQDGDQDGDACDLDDGALWFYDTAGSGQSWQDETLYDAFNLYRGDLTVLRAGGDYTQDPAGALVDRFCGLEAAAHDDGYVPPAGEAVFYLVTGTSSIIESSLGASRPNANPCPGS